MQKQEITTTITYKYSKGVNWNDATIVFYDTKSVLEQLHIWRDLVHTVNEGVLSHSDYKKDSVIDELDGKGNVLRSIKLKNSWPLNIDYGKLSHADSNINLVELVLSTDYVEIS
jgi:hypothetical protein